MTEANIKSSAGKKAPAKPKSRAAKPAAARPAAPPAAAPDELNERQKLFCLEYIVDFNGTQAAIRAGYSAKSARAIASELLTKPNIQAEVHRQIEARTQRTKINADWVLDRLTRELQADIADLYDEDDNLKPVREWPIEWRTGLVAGLETEELKLVEPEEDDVDEEQEPQGHGGSLKRSRKKKDGPSLTARVRKVKFSDRKGRIELAGKHVDVQAFKDRKEHTVSEPLQQLLDQIGGRAIRPASEAKS